MELSVALLSMDKHTEKERGMGWGHRSAKMLDFPKVSYASSRPPEAASLERKRHRKEIAARLPPADKNWSTQADGLVKSQRENREVHGHSKFHQVHVVVRAQNLAQRYNRAFPVSGFLLLLVGYKVITIWSCYLQRIET